MFDCVALNNNIVERIRKKIVTSRERERERERERGREGVLEREREGRRRCVCQEEKTDKPPKKSYTMFLILSGGWLCWWS